MNTPANAASTTILAESSTGFSDPMKLKALEIKARIQSGETVPLDELILFLSEGKKDLGKKPEAKPAPKAKPTDVDFF